MFAEEPAAAAAVVQVGSLCTSDLLWSRCNSQLQGRRCRRCWFPSAGAPLETRGNIRPRRSGRLEVLPADSLKDASTLGNIKKTSLPKTNKWHLLKVWQRLERDEKRTQERRPPVGDSQSQSLLVTLESLAGPRWLQNTDHVV